MKKPFTSILCIDFETVWSSKDTNSIGKYSLSFSTTEAYIRDPRFKAFGLCIHEYGSTRQTQWYRTEEIPRILATYDWSKTAVLAQNAVFDTGILSFIYDVHPCFIFDTLSMARALRGADGGNSLMQLAKEYGLPPKGNAVHSTDGLTEITPEVESELAAYCAHDVYLCEQIFTKLMQREFPDGSSAGPFPTKELRLIDMTVKMFTEPVFMLDKELLQQALIDEKEKLRVVLEKANATEAALASAGSFGELLRSVGVEPPVKPSPSNKEKLIPAFAKGDALFQALLNGDNEDAVVLCEARLSVKSTQERTRAQRFIDIAERGTLPVPLFYYGAATGRYSATQKLNLQNMKRGSFLRKAITAPEGYVVCAGDLSQIEPRVLAWLADYDDMLDIFRGGGDPYATFGSQMFNIPGMTKESHPLLRQSAKSALLGAGYGLGWASFAAQLLVGFLGAPPVRYTKADAKKLGVTAGDVQSFLLMSGTTERLQEIPHTCTDVELLTHCVAAKAIIDKYRAAAAPVVAFWRMLDQLIRHSLLDGNEYVHKGVAIFRRGEIELVNGMRLYYRDLRAETDEKGRVSYTFNAGKTRKSIYSGLMANNVTQGLARIIMTDGMLRVSSRFPARGTVHDEGLYTIPEATAAEDSAWIKDQMIAVPKWMQGIPLNADVGYHKSYGHAKS